MSDVESYDLVVYDEDCEAMGGVYRSRAEVYNGYIDRYTSILRTILDNGVKEGVVHDNLESFLDRVSQLKDQTTELASDASDNLNNFISDMDTADSYVY